MNTRLLAENLDPDTGLQPRLVNGYKTTIDRIAATLRATSSAARCERTRMRASR